MLHRFSSHAVLSWMMRSGLCSLLVLLASSAQPANAVEIQFDYSRDATGFFAPGIRRERLEQAALTFKPFTDQLTAITPGGGNSFSGSFWNPVTGASDSAPLTVPANTVIVFVGARDWPDGRPGIGQFGGYSASGTTAFVQNAGTRGQVLGSGSVATDFATWGGYISFDETRTWNSSADLPSADETDLLSVAIRELAHVLGFGYSDSWKGATTGSISAPRFVGRASTAEFGQSSVPLFFGGGDWQEGLQSGGQEIAMDPTLALGTRKLFTPLDYAGMADVGWQLPEPADLSVFAFAGLLLTRRRSKSHG